MKPDCAKFVAYNQMLPTSGLHMIKTKTYRGVRAGDKQIYEFIGYNKLKDTATRIPDKAKKINLPRNLIAENYCGDKIPLRQDKSKLTRYKDDKHYFIHDNGGRPFIVYINEKYADVLRIPRNMYVPDDTKFNKNHYTEKLVGLTPQRVFVGKSPKNPMTEFSGGHGREFQGNSILVKIGKNKYVYIGGRVFSFASLSEIMEYISPVGNNDVPYPWALDQDGNIYLFTYSVVMLNKEKPLPRFSKKSDPYNYFDDHKKEKSLMTMKIKEENIVRRLV